MQTTNAHMGDRVKRLDDLHAHLQAEKYKKEVDIQPTMTMATVENQPAALPQYLTTQEVCAWLRVSRGTFYRVYYSKLLQDPRTVFTPTRLPRYDRRSLPALLGLPPESDLPGGADPRGEGLPSARPALTQAQNGRR